MGRNGEGEEGSVVHNRTLVTDETNKKVIAKCSCGAAWSHGFDATYSQMDSIFESHKAYFNKPKTKVD